MAFYGDYDPSVEIKVKFGDTIKRMEILDSLDLDSLRMKIRDSFNIPANADFTLTYADYDGDVVTICDDNEVLERAARQGKINVQLSNNKGVDSYAQSGGGTSTQLSSLQVQHPFPNIKTGVIAEGLQSMPQQICEALKLHEALLKISEDIVSKAITGPVLVELADFISKMTQSYLNLDSQSTDQSRADSTTHNKKNKNKNKNKKTTQNMVGGAKLRMPYGDLDDEGPA